MDILLIGSGYFKPWLVKAGVNVRHLGLGEDCEIKADPNRVDLQAIISRMERKPDLLLLTDDLGARVLPFGLERVLIPKVYYGVDSPINLFWQKHLAGLFDLVLLDQRDQARNLSARLDREIHWLPVAVDPSLYIGPPEKRAHDFAFVGTVEKNVRPKRTAILSLLRERYSVKLAGGRGEGWVGPQEAGRLYRSSRLVLNENLFPGLTTRMLEVMACGGCLFSEDVDNGLKDLFLPGTHYIAFNHSNLLDLARQYINDPGARKDISQKGAEVCRSGHSIQARVQKLLSFIQGLKPGTGAPDLNSLGWSFLLLGVRWPGQESSRRIIKAGFLFKEHLRRNPYSTQAAIGAALALAARSRQTEALDHLREMKIPTDRDFRLPLIRAYILHDLGKRAEAAALFDLAAEMADPYKRAGQGNQGLSPGSPEFHHLWGLILDQGGNGLWPGFDRSHLPPAFWGGVEHLRRAVELDPRKGEAVRSLARIMDREGQFAFSHLLWQKALDLDPEDKAVQDAYLQAARKGYARI